MRRRRLPSLFAMAIFLAGVVMTAWAASGAAVVAGAGPEVIVSLDSKNLLRLYCNDGVGHKDAFCRSDAGGGNLTMNFDLGLDDEEYGLQPGSRYTFGNVMFIEHIWSEVLDVFVKVDGDGDLMRVLTVFMEAPNGDRIEMFPGKAGEEQTVPMNPDDIAALSFGFDVPDEWGSFESADARYKLNGAVTVRIGIEDEDDTPPGGGGRPRPRPTSPDDEVDEDDDDPLAGLEPPEEPGQPEPEIEIITEDEAPEAGPLPRTGGSTWPYILLGLLLMAIGAGLYRWGRGRPAEANNDD